VEHPQDEQHARLAVLGADRAQFASTIRMSRASMISRSGMSVGWLKNRRSGGTPVSPEILLRGASSRSATRLVAIRRSSGSSQRKNSAV
jgi:hypothetical protein